MYLPNNIPTPQEVISLITLHKTSYYKIIKNHYPELFAHALTCYGTRLAEQLYNYCYAADRRCIQCGGTNVKFMEFTTGYKQYCSHKCVVNSDVVKAGKLKFQANAVKVANKLNKLQSTSLARFGASSYMASVEGKARMSVQMTNLYSKKFPSEINGRSCKQYTSAACYRTNKIYEQFRHILDPNSLRSMDWVIDHIYSLNDGFKNNVPLDIICHPANLRLCSKSENSSKHCRSDKTLTDLHKDINNWK